jgi:hypothetical protein
MPLQRANQLEVVQTAVPTVQTDALGLQTPLLGRTQQVAKQVVLAVAIVDLIVKAVIAEDVSVAVGPQQRQQVDAFDGAAVLARPVPAHQVHVAGIRFIQGGVVENQDAVVAAQLLLGFTPEGFGVWLLAGQQSREGVVRRLLGLDASGLGAGELGRRSQQELDVVFRLYFRSVDIPYYASERTVVHYLLPRKAA